MGEDKASFLLRQSVYASVHPTRAACSERQYMQLVVGLTRLGNPKNVVVGWAEFNAPPDTV